MREGEAGKRVNWKSMLRSIKSNFFLIELKRFLLLL